MVQSNFADTYRSPVSVSPFSFSLLVTIHWFVSLSLSLGVYLPVSLSLSWGLRTCRSSSPRSLYLSLFLALTWCLFTFPFFFLSIFSLSHTLSLTVSASHFTPLSLSCSPSFNLCFFYLHVSLPLPIFNQYYKISVFLSASLSL